MQLSAQTTVLLAPAVTTKTNNVSVNFMNDNLSQVTCQVQYDDGTIQNLTLWNGNSNPPYASCASDGTSNWTQNDANNRILYLLYGGAF